MSAGKALAESWSEGVVNASAPRNLRFCSPPSSVYPQMKETLTHQGLRSDSAPLLPTMELWAFPQERNSS